MTWFCDRKKGIVPQGKKLYNVERLVNKYYDLALAGDAMAAGHYEKLAVKASACVGCGHCDRRCPFHVRQSGRMREIAAYFEQR